MADEDRPETGEPGAGPSGGPAVDVVLPVYGPSPDLARCLGSIRAFTDLRRHRVVVVADGPLPESPARLVGALEAFRPEGVLVLRRPERRGYVASTNAGMRASDRDVVLLNSDTEVAEGWLENLQAAACSAPGIASATPFSSNASLASLPFPFTANRVPSGHTVTSFARLVSERSARSRPRIPTGVGFCLYLRRDALADAGLFDEERFGLGYGEEVDLCLRLTARGWSHVLDDATYVWHRGSGSFGGETAGRARAAERLLARRHPLFLPRLAEFMREDPLRAARERVLDALRPPRARGSRPVPRVLHLAPAWQTRDEGGIAGRVRAIVLEQATRGEVAACAARGTVSPDEEDGCELWDSGVRVRFVDGAGNADPAALGRFLDDVKPEIVHVHEPGGALGDVLRRVRRRGAPIVVHLHEDPPRGAGERSALRRAVEAARTRVALDAHRYVADSDAVLARWTDAGSLPGSAPVEVLPSGGASTHRDHAARRLEQVYSELLGSGGAS